MNENRFSDGRWGIVVGSSDLAEMGILNAWVIMLCYWKLSGKADLNIIIVEF